MYLLGFFFPTPGIFLGRFFSDPWNFLGFFFSDPWNFLGGFFSDPWNFLGGFFSDPVREGQFLDEGYTRFCRKKKPPKFGLLFPDSHQ